MKMKQTTATTPDAYAEALSGWQRACDALLDRLEWQGVAMVECKRDLDRGGWRAMEINGRFWGSLQLAVDAGVDFPRLLAAAALSGPPVLGGPAARLATRPRSP